MITALQTQIAGWLAADPDFAGPPEVPILTERIGDWLNKLDITVNHVLGLCLVVSTPVITPSGDGPLSVEAAVAIHIWENVTRNMASDGRRLPAPDAALRALGALAGREPSGGWSPLQLRKLQLAEAATGSLLMYELVLGTGIRLRVAQVP